MTASPNCSWYEISHELHFKYHKAKCIHDYSLLSEEFWCYFLFMKGYFLLLDMEYPPFYLFILPRLIILQFDIYLKVENPPLLLVITSLLLFLICVPGTKVMKTKPLLLQGDTV